MEVKILEAMAADGRWSLTWHLHPSACACRFIHSWNNPRRPDCLAFHSTHILPACKCIHFFHSPTVSCAEVQHINTLLHIVSPATYIARPTLHHPHQPPNTTTHSLKTSFLLHPPGSVDPFSAYFMPTHLSQQDLSNRLVLAVTLVIAPGVFKTALADRLPSIGYLTTMDRHFIFVYFFILTSCIGHASLHTLGAEIGYRDDTVLLINDLTAVLFVTLLAVYHINHYFEVSGGRHSWAGIRRCGPECSCAGAPLGGRTCND
eukprot:365928-Chlamydomonas_euryale.AAC.10